MKKIKINSFCVMFLVSFCLALSSCKMPENILQKSSEVDFSTPKKVQVTFNEHVYDTTIVFNNQKLEINFINEKDLLNGAYICIDANSYKITYKDMVFKGGQESLSGSFLPCIIYSFINSFENVVILDSYDKERECHYTKRSTKDRFVILEAYETDDETEIYSMEIK